MEKYGAVKLINLPKKDDGKMFGYGFVVFEDIDDAKKAIKEINSRTDKFMGTKFVADWCLPKNLYLKNSSKKTFI
jgi:RNA recognition motif-containing protein